MTGQTSTEQADDADWIPIKKQSPFASKEDVVVSIAERIGAKTGRASICFRHAAGEFMQDHDSIDIDVGGRDLNLVRVTRHKKGKGEFKLAFPGRGGGTRTPRATFSVDVWPNEARSRPATYRIDGNQLVATLPKDWAKALVDIKGHEQTNSAGLPEPARPAAAMPGTPVRTGNTIPVRGEPPPGRSALDARRQAGR